MVEEVKLTVPVVADLRNGTLTERHWDELDGVLGVNVREEGAVTFKHMMEVTPKTNGDALKYMLHDTFRPLPQINYLLAELSSSFSSSVSDDFR